MSSRERIVELTGTPLVYGCSGSSIKDLSPSLCDADSNRLVALFTVGVAMAHHFNLFIHHPVDSKSPLSTLQKGRSKRAR
jgi:hypothetical protein